METANRQSVHEIWVNIRLSFYRSIIQLDIIMSGCFLISITKKRMKVGCYKSNFWLEPFVTIGTLVKQMCFGKGIFQKKREPSSKVSFVTVIWRIDFYGFINFHLPSVRSSVAERSIGLEKSRFIKTENGVILVQFTV